MFSSTNKRLAILICLVGLTLVICQAAELPQPPDAQGPPTKPAGPDQMSPPDVGQPDDQDDEQFDDEDDEEDEGEEEDAYYEDEEEDEYDEEDEEDDEEGSPEEELAWLSEQHFLIKSDCKELNQTAFEECTSDLDEIESRMRELVNQITGDQ
jgi:hypothetical protein